MQPEAMHVRRGTGCTLHVSIRGAGGGPSLVLLHGFTGSSSAWGEPIFHPLLEASPGVRPPSLLAADLLGHGQSTRHHDPARYRMSEMVADVGAIIDNLPAGSHPPVLCGYSMGGRVALAFAVTNPGRIGGLILESASPGLANPGERAARRDTDAQLARGLDDHGIEWFVDHWMDTPLFATQRAMGTAWLERERDRRLTNDSRALAACLRGLGTGSQPSFWSQLPSLELPTLILTGGRDEKFTAIGLRMHDLIPSSRHVAVAEAGHAVHAERPGDWVEHVSAFLNDTVAT